MLLLVYEISFDSLILAIEELVEKSPRSRLRSKFFFFLSKVPEFLHVSFN